MSAIVSRSNAAAHTVIRPKEWTDERALIARVLARDSVAERLFYDIHVTSVYQLALRMTQDTELAQDCTQETFIRAFDRLGQFRGEAPVAAWLRRVTISVVLNELERRKTRQATELSLEETVLEDMAVDPGPLGVTWPDLPAQLAVALHKLPASHRDVVILHDMDGHTHVSIAAALGITVSASKVRLCRARARLRLALTDYVSVQCSTS